MPDWLTALAPHTGAPDRLERRLQRNDVAEVAVKGRTGGVLTLTLIYPEIDGRTATGQLRLFVPPEVRDGKRVPLVHNAGYEIDENGVRHLLEKGYAVSTIHAHPLNPLGRGVNLDRAVLHAVRRLPWIDPGRVHIQGGSAGGWMTLMLAADAFPLLCSLPDVPPIHWGYNAAYIADQQALAGPEPGKTEPRLFGVQAVGVIATQCNTTYGMPFDSATYLANSPLAHLDTITAPTLATFSTADMLVPIDQVDKALIRRFDPARFPQGFTSAMGRRFPGVRGKRTLLAALPPDRVERFVVPVTPGLPEVPLNATPPAGFKAPRPIVLPFSKTRTWSIVVVDEGAQTPHTGHLKHPFGMDHEPFRRWATGRGVMPDQLTAPVLERLMKRLRGEPWRPFQIRPGDQGAPTDGNALDWPEAERADVLLCLRAFAETDDACAERLGELYGALPRRLKALGKALGDGSSGGVRAALAAL